MRRLTAKILTLAFTFAPSLLFAQSNVPAYMNQEVSSETYATQKIAQGYYPEIFTKINLTIQNRVEARKSAEKIINQSYSTSPAVDDTLKFNKAEQNYNVDATIRDVMKANKQSETIAAATGEFTYIPNSDGKITYFINGLPSTILNERVVDEYGNVSRKNTYNMHYNDRRLLIGYEATLRDQLGNVSTVVLKDMQYSPDSVFYGNMNTNANKNITAYTLIETSSNGNTTTTKWQADSYSGKLVTAYSVYLQNKVLGDKPYTTETTYQRFDIAYKNNLAVSWEEKGTKPNGLDYRLIRTDTRYDSTGNVSGYHEERWDKATDGKETKTTTDAEFEYLPAPIQFGKDVDPDQARISKSKITTTTESPDGSVDTETRTINYQYDKNMALTGATGAIEKNGKASSSIEYRDAAGHDLFTAKDNDGNITGYFYLDSNNKAVQVEKADVQTVEVNDTYTGSGTMVFEVIGGIPMEKSESMTLTTNSSKDGSVKSTITSTKTFTNGLVNNLPRVLSYREVSSETLALKDKDGTAGYSNKDITTTNTYDSLGNLIGVAGTGTQSGYELTEYGWKHYNKENNANVTVTYDVKLGVPVVNKETVEIIYSD